MMIIMINIKKNKLICDICTKISQRNKVILVKHIKDRLGVEMFVHKDPYVADRNIVTFDLPDDDRLDEIIKHVESIKNQSHH